MDSEMISRLDNQRSRRGFPATKAVLLSMFVLWLSGCDMDDTLSPVQSEQSLVGVDTYLYFTCNATGWELNDATRVADTEAPELFQLSYEVTQPWMKDDDCVLVETNQLNGWGTEQTYYRLRNMTLLDAPGGAPIQKAAGYTRFDVQYPSLGVYTITANMARGSIHIVSSNGGVFQYDVTVAVDDAVYDALAEELGSGYQGDDSVEPLIVELLARNDAVFNDPQVFSKEIHFALDSFYMFTGDPCSEWYSGEDNYADVRLVISNVDQAGCSTGIISERRIFLEADGLDGLFDSAKTDVVLAHECAHAIGMYDIYGLDALGYTAESTIMATADPTSAVWHPTTMWVINTFMSAADPDALPWGLLHTDYVADTVKIAAKDENGVTLPNLDITVIGSPLLSNEPDFEIYSGVTDGNGELTFPPEPYAIDPSVPSYHPIFGLFAGSATVEDGSDILHGEVFLPLHEAQLAHFEQRDYVMELNMIRIQLGDVNGDGEIGPVDALMTDQYRQGMTVAEPFFEQLADVDCDGEITYDDALLMATGGPFSCT